MRLIRNLKNHQGDLEAAQKRKKPTSSIQQRISEDTQRLVELVISFLQRPLPYQDQHKEVIDRGMRPCLRKLLLCVKAALQEPESDMIDELQSLAQQAAGTDTVGEIYTEYEVEEVDTHTKSDTDEWHIAYSDNLLATGIFSSYRPCYIDANIHS